MRGIEELMIHLIENGKTENHRNVLNGKQQTVFDKQVWVVGNQQKGGTEHRNISLRASPFYKI